MKTATITYHNVYNYGALLQAYALQQAQLRMEIDNNIINYSHETGKSFHRIKGSSPKIFAVNIIRRIATVKKLRTIKKRNSIFEEFTNNKLRLTQRYRSYEELRSNPPVADWYIAGSDQLWNVSDALREAFYLDFGGQEVRRASYAVSMGSCEVPDRYKEHMCELLRRFDRISVREPEAKSYIENMLDKKDFVSLNFDPVFLLSGEEWASFAHFRKIEFKYILCYPMAGHPLLNAALDKLRRLTGYRIVTVTTDIFTGIKGDLDIEDASPEELVYLIQNAEYVLTTSFHGTAFCTIFNKNFYSFVGACSPLRIRRLLERLGLEDRIVGDIEDIDTRDIDFARANEIIGREKALSEEYLLSLSDYKPEP